MNVPPLDSARRYHEVHDPLRSPFELDRHRILSCTAFRRLQNKTQVFAPGFHDHFRNRLTHSLEVASIARCLARLRGADADLSEAIALAHDLGHPPFSHAGEKTLDELMAGRGGFNHNAHSLRVVEYLEHPYPDFRGLNLTRAVLDGLRVHITRFDTPSDEAIPASEEASIVSLADRIAYDLHDLEDALGAELICSAEVEEITLWCDALSCLSDTARIGPVFAVRRPVLDTMLAALLSGLSKRGADLPPEANAKLGELESLLIEKVYQHPEVVRADAEGRTRIHELFAAYMKVPDLLPERFRKRIAEHGPHRVICDYIAGMTDPFCTAQHALHCRGTGQPR